MPAVFGVRVVSYRHSYVTHRHIDGVSGRVIADFYRFVMERLSFRYVLEMLVCLFYRRGRYSLNKVSVLEIGIEFGSFQYRLLLRICLVVESVFVYEMV